MKCDDCEFAEWLRKVNGTLHPDKSGMCKRLEVHPVDLRLPAAFDWVSITGPRLFGGVIKRGTELSQNCVFKSVKP